MMKIFQKVKNNKIFFFIVKNENFILIFKLKNNSKNEKKIRSLKIDVNFVYC